MPKRRNTEVASVAEIDRKSSGFPGTQRFRRERTVMTRICALVTAAIWILGTGFLQAEENTAAPPATVPKPCTTCTQDSPGAACCAPRPRLREWLAPPRPCCAQTSCAQTKGAAPRHCLVEWLTYRPLSRCGFCCGGQKAAPCCTPPLYTFFLHDCAGSGLARCCGAKADCTGDGCQRQPLLGFLHGRSCGQKACQPCCNGSGDGCKDTSSCAGSCWDRLSFFRFLRSQPGTEGPCLQ